MLIVRVHTFIAMAKDFPILPCNEFVGYGWAGLEPGRLQLVLSSVAIPSLEKTGKFKVTTFDK